MKKKFIILLFGLVSILGLISCNEDKVLEDDKSCFYEFGTVELWKYDERVTVINKGFPDPVDRRRALKSALESATYNLEKGHATFGEIRDIMKKVGFTTDNLDSIGSTLAEEDECIITIKDSENKRVVWGYIKVD